MKEIEKPRKREPGIDTINEILAVKFEGGKRKQSPTSVIEEGPTMEAINRLGKQKKRLQTLVDILSNTALVGMFRTPEYNPNFAVQEMPAFTQEELSDELRAKAFEERKRT